MKKFFKDFYGNTARIIEHRDGSATLSIYAGGKRTKKKYKNAKSARSAWYRFCD